MIFHKQTLWGFGKGLGGSSLINFLMYVRGNKEDYNKWAEDGADGWAYEDVLPYFIKSEDNLNKEYAKSGMLHGSFIMDPYYYQIILILSLCVD